MPYLLAGPFVALIGIVAIFFVLRRKSVEKRSMYSARRSQIEHKVRAARQRTLTPHGRSQKPAEQTIPGATQAPQPEVQPTMVWETTAYQAPPAAPPPRPTMPEPRQAPGQSPWDVPPAAAPTFDYPPAAPAEPAYEPARPAPPAPFSEPAPSEPAWTPAPRPAETIPPAEPVAPAAAATPTTSAGGGWSIVSTDKESAATGAPEDNKKRKKDKATAGTASGSWSLASGDVPGTETDEPELRRPAGTLMAVAQYAVLVVGLVMVLIGVLVMVANSHVT